MKRLSAIFVLSRSEQRIVIIIVLLLVIATLVKHQRYAHLMPFHCTPATTPERSASPAAPDNEQ